MVPFSQAVCLIVDHNFGNEILESKQNGLLGYFLNVQLTLARLHIQILIDEMCTTETPRTTPSSWFSFSVIVDITQFTAKMGPFATTARTVAQYVMSLERSQSY